MTFKQVLSPHNLNLVEVLKAIKYHSSIYECIIVLEISFLIVTKFVLAIDD